MCSSEPLYQVYNRCTLRRERNLSRRRISSDTSLNDEASLEELTRGTLRNMRMLWCELPEVIQSGILDLMNSDDRKRQEAMFEVITSEASYIRSLNILMLHFLSSDDLSPGSSLCVLERGQSHVLFSNISAIKSVSESFLQALRVRQKEALVMSSISDIILEYATKYFEVYVKYCSNQIYQDRALKNLRKSVRFVDAVEKLQSSKKAQGLTLQSFLVLPMQRITRLPLLVNAICHRCEAGSDEYIKTDRALAAINKIVNDCNEGARKMERMEEICVLQTQIEFKTKPLALATPSRYLLRRGDLMHVVEDSRNPLKRLRPKFKPMYMFLFNDLLLLVKKKSENRFVVLDYATRNMTQVDEPQEWDVSIHEHMFSLVLLENSESKTKEFLMAGNSETDKTRWMEAFKPPAAEQEGETVYASWDCPQVNALHNYSAQQPDELSLYEGDVINVLKKLRMDGITERDYVMELRLVSCQSHRGNTQ
ncbi:Rho guanine nucleotide exchange factor 26 [Desmophyllum pertusum]|uniref:Rho guanine nucleotide exchange factor 26 n=1 Tax=Desmophyllum pertusum TaxID=174260 RepID=A0A9W9ZDH7_9CNID|nr:Rho guanine nucleotide exchange factor 26 [Desmophyllum pertusum]